MFLCCFVYYMSKIVRDDHYNFPESNSVYLKFHVWSNQHRYPLIFNKLFNLKNDLNFFLKDCKDKDEFCNQSFNIQLTDMN